MASVIVIGVGSTGLAVMEQAQQFYYEFTKKNSPGTNSDFIYIETDANRHPAVTPNGSTDINSCHVMFKNIDATLSGWHSANEPEWKAWMPTTAAVLNSHTGAAGQPVIGRVALWANENVVMSQIKQSYQKVGGDQFTNIYLVGSLTGGTGTGIFLDLAYMIKYCTGNDNIYGMFLLPDKLGVGEATKSTIYENAYSSLRSLDKFCAADEEKNENYKCKLPSGTDISSLSAPFYNVQFYTCDFDNAQAALPTLGDLVRSVGFNLVLRLLDVDNQSSPCQDIVNSRIVDYTSKVDNGLFTTIGFNMYQYPEALLEEYFTTRLIETELLDRWVDPSFYIDKNDVKQPIAGVKSKLKNLMSSFVEEAIDSVVDKSQGNQMLTYSSFTNAVNSEINTIQKGEHQGPKMNYIFSLFDANSKKANFYAAITGQALSLRDYMIEAIYDRICEDSTEYQNFNVINIELKELSAYIDDVLADWKRRLKIDGSPVLWNKMWGELLPQYFKTQWIYSATATSTANYADVFKQIGKLCYYNALIPMLSNISKLIKGVNGVSEMTTAMTNKSLPTLSACQSVIGKINTLLDLQKQESVVARNRSIGGQLSQTNNPQINFLFNGDSYQDDINSAKGQYDNQNERLSYTAVFKEYLWKYLIEKTELEIRANLIQTSLSFIQKLHLFANTNIVSIMQNLPKKHKLYNKVHSLLSNTAPVIKQDLPAMCSLTSKEQFMPHVCLRLIVMSPQSETNANGIVAAMNYKTSVVNSDYVQLRSMKNTVVVYQEYGYLGSVNGKDKVFNPLLHLSYQNQVLQSLKDKIKNGTYDRHMRLAYIDPDTLTDTANIKIK